MKALKMLRWATANRWTLGKLRDELHRKAVPLRRVTIADIVDACCATRCSNGIYAFFLGGARDGLVYVGSATSRSFIERIPAHFDLRRDAYMNGVLRAPYKRRVDMHDDRLCAHWRERRDKLRLALLGVDGPPYQPREPHRLYAAEVRALEKGLQRAWRPRWNSVRHAPVPSETRVKDLVPDGTYVR